MNANRPSLRDQSRRVSVKRRFGAAMPATALSTLRGRRGRPGLFGRGSDMAVESQFAVQCRARLAAMPPTFLDWLDAMPAWPDGVPELIGASPDEP